MIDIAVVDNDRMLLEGIGRWLEGVQDVRLVATATTVEELLGRPVHIDVVLLDLLLGDHSVPLDNLARLIGVGHRVLVVSVSSNEPRIAATFAAGARGYLTKDHDLVELAAAVREIDSAGVSLSPELAFACLRDPRPGRPMLTERERAVLSGLGSGMRLAAVARHIGTSPEIVQSYVEQIAAKYHQTAARPEGLGALTIREREIAWLVTEGMTNSQIARRLGVTAKTVEKHLGSTMSKLGVPSRAAVAGLIGQAGWTT
jgi:two-component system, NarL family, nitrate/nitrite response regulator NarL